MSDGFPVLWLHGPPGVGKSTVAWQLFTSLALPTGYVDIDQLGMCYGPPTAHEWAPDPLDDPGRYRLKENNLHAVIENYQRAGARGLIVSGIVDPVRGVPGFVTACRLRCEPDELRRRLAERGRPNERVEEILEYACLLDGLPGTCIDSTGLTVAETVQLVVEVGL
jgi:hypothetical protein